MPFNKKKLFKLAKGFRGRAKNCQTIARRRVEKSLQYSYSDRRTRKREFRSLWIQQVNAGVRQFGMKYSTFVWGLEHSNIKLNRNMLSELARHEPYSFKSVVDCVKNSVLALPPHHPQLKALITTMGKKPKMIRELAVDVASGEKLD